MDVAPAGPAAGARPRRPSRPAAARAAAGSAAGLGLGNGCRRGLRGGGRGRRERRRARRGRLDAGVRCGVGCADRGRRSGEPGPTRAADRPAAGAGSEIRLLTGSIEVGPWLGGRRGRPRRSRTVRTPERSVGVPGVSLSLRLMRIKQDSPSRRRTAPILACRRPRSRLEIVPRGTSGRPPGALTGRVTLFHVEHECWPGRRRSGLRSAPGAGVRTGASSPARRCGGGSGRDTAPPGGAPVVELLVDRAPAAPDRTGAAGPGWPPGCRSGRPSRSAAGGSETTSQPPTLSRGAAHSATTAGRPNDLASAPS